MEINDEKLREAMKRAARIVKTWPLWKQNVLKNSLRAANDYSRLPVKKDLTSNTF